ncbi:hypothetical protein F2Q70_00011342 [Brassica cretica]|uniref:Uncharacterized protein n=1 Tax=Brassica cretica TaxID=69181 RepID=A0A8S9NZ37_BRACR|nr:hypothetical protein F2Q68_00004484 [Brassica cretica]KAF2615081.1 hypothetical protein F2Q70_00011342 [Brassica cretica]KAF3510218.1 hypothetical protein F2Q69_00005827 [Brassica cretica]
MKPTSRDDETDVLLKNDETDISFMMITSHAMETIKPLRISRCSRNFHLKMYILQQKRHLTSIWIKPPQPKSQ